MHRRPVLRSSPWDWPVEWASAVIFGIIWFVVWIALWNCTIIMMYHDLRVAKEGIDTEQIAAIFD